MSLIFQPQNISR